MSAMVERAQFVVEAHLGRCADTGAPIDPKAVARDVLAAMREPTHDMTIRGGRVGCCPECVGAVWREMVDAAGDGAP